MNIGEWKSLPEEVTSFRVINIGGDALLAATTVSKLGPGESVTTLHPESTTDRNGLGALGIRTALGTALAREMHVPLVRQDLDPATGQIIREEVLLDAMGNTPPKES